MIVNLDATRQSEKIKVAKNIKDLLQINDRYLSSRYKMFYYTKRI